MISYLIILGTTAYMAPHFHKFMTLPVAAIIYTKVFVDTPASPSDISTEGEAERILHELEQARHFYWINSGMRLNIELHPIVIDSLKLSSEIYSPEEYRPPKPELVKKILTEHGLQNVVGVVHIAVELRFNANKGKYVYTGAGGGLTCGVGDSGYGISWWQSPPPGAYVDNSWLFVHEFNHQVDALFHASGYPEYWFNHPSPTENNVARFGEHFDCNAYILRKWPDSLWFNMKFGMVDSSLDMDADGFPDNDNRMPLDEVRFGSSSKAIDTDHDGLTDKEEAMLLNWCDSGVDERFCSGHYMPDPRSMDSDGDGIPDSADIYPVYPISTRITRTDWWNCPFNDSLLSGDVWISRTDSSLIFKFELDKEAKIKIQIDADDNGWFIGRDNYKIVINPDGSLGAKLIVNASIPGEWPFNDKKLLADDNIRSFKVEHEGKYIYYLEVPRNYYTGMELLDCEIMGFLFGFRPLGYSRYITVFEPHHLIRLMLSGDCPNL